MTSPRQQFPIGAHRGASANIPASMVASGIYNRLRQIQAILAPVIGQGGVTALYERSRHISSRLHPWLAAPQAEMAGAMDLEGLKSVVAQQSDDVAAAGAGLLLESFHGLLAGLVGSSLTVQLIGASPSADPEADKTR